MIGFCITCKGRLQHVQQTLPRNLANNPGTRSKFILIDYNSQDGLVEYLKETHWNEILSGKLVVYSYPAAQVFNMTHAKNMAHRCAMLEGCDILCNLDGDNFTGPWFDFYLEQMFQGRNNIFAWAKMFTQANGRRPRGISGRIVVTAQQFMRIGGYDEKFDTWNHDDKDFNMRLRLSKYEGVEIAEEHLDVVLHSNKMRFRDYPHAKELNVDSTDANISPTCCIANWGKIGCGTVFRNFDFNNPIVLNPLPTRIFGCGMHKTGTTSLDAALRILGVESAHWVTAHWAKAVWDDTHQYGRSWAIDHSYAVSDLPITLLYRELDHNYPGSKFILTVRNEGAWLKSVENHWSYKHNQYRWQWDQDPFSHRIHNVLYGQKTFDAVVFLQRYRRHNQEVREYFKDRPGDLLEMNLSHDDGWPQLCAFLGKPIPKEPYPKKLVTQD